MTINEGKSSIFSSGTNDETKHLLLNFLRFKEGKLPVKYLCVPLVSTRLKKEHCAGLLSKIDSRINSVSGRLLSYAGRLQLINSVLRSVQVYWCFLC